MSIASAQWMTDVERDTPGDMDEALERVRLALLERGAPPEVFERVNIGAPYALIRLASDLLRKQEGEA